MRQLLPLAAGACLLIFAGVVHALWTNRWTADDQLDQAVARLATVPLDIGDWHGEKLDLQTNARTSLPGVLSRRYVHQLTGKSVSLYLGCGKPGPASVHTPDVCYAGTGFRAETPHRFPLSAAEGSPGGEFWLARFVKNQAAAQSQLRIFWAWNGGDGWRVADNPRVAFAPYPVLYKLYVIRELADAAEPAAKDDPCVDFLNVLLPELDRKLFSQPTNITH
jgi:hypothetical protein